MFVIIQLTICIVLILLFITLPGITHKGADLGLALFIESLFPYLLPYAILCNWLLYMTINIRLPKFLKLLKIYTLSSFGGFPTGAMIISQLYIRKALPKKTAEWLLGICHSPSPLFVLGFVSIDLLKNETFGWTYLFIYHTFSFMLLAFLYKHLSISAGDFPKIQHPFSTSIRSSIQTVFIVGSTIVFFSTVLYAIQYVIHEKVSVQHLFFMSAFLEMTNGLVIATSSSIIQNTNLIIAFLLTIQSVSIHLQVVTLCAESNLSLKRYILIRLLYTICIPLLLMIIQKGLSS